MDKVFSFTGSLRAPPAPTKEATGTTEELTKEILE